MSRRLMVLLASVMLLGACASIESTPSNNPGDGLVYYMPKKDVLVTVVRGTATTVVTIAPTPAYADLANPYVLNFKRNWLGKNEIEIGVKSTGLLTSAKSTTTSGVGEALKNLATSLGSFKGLSAPPDKTKPCLPGTFTYLYDVATDDLVQPCGLTITIQRVAASKASSGTTELDATTKTRKTEAGKGIFYRQEEAFRVKVVGDANQPPVDTAAIILSPSKSPVRFLPIEKTLFASNKADFGFDDGMPTKYDQNADGELIALFKLPADVIGAYFSAVGNVFGSLKDNSNKEGDALVASMKLELAKKKYDACVQALREKNDTLVQQLECGK